MLQTLNYRHTKKKNPFYFQQIPSENKLTKEKLHNFRSFNRQHAVFRTNKHTQYRHLFQ